jgi:protein gp37
MAENSRIEWTDHTFNPWWGCTKVSPACDNCYAEAWARRTGHSVWGAKTERRFLSDFYWKQPLRWNRDAGKRRRRERVFCASMADVFEWRADLSPWRARLWDLIEQTPNLDWLLLTKRPHLGARLTPWGNAWPRNVWMGTTIESQRMSEKRMHHLLALPATVRFVSCEPLRTRLDMTPFLSSGELDWVIAGGESGANARPADPNWFRDLRDQCIANGVPFHFKQWGEWAPLNDLHTGSCPISMESTAWSEPLGRFGKKRSGRMLDGREWNQVPVPSVTGRLALAAL